MNIQVTINAPEIVGALNNLANAFSGKLGASAPQQSVPVTAPPQPQQPEQTYQAPQAVPTAPLTPAAATTPPQTNAFAVPTSAPQYTLEQLGVAAGPLVDQGKSPELTGWLNQRGYQALTQLPKELYGEFAMYLRSLGAKI